MIKVVYYISKIYGTVTFSEATFGVPECVCDNDIFDTLYDGTEDDFDPKTCPTEDMYDKLVDIFTNHGLYPVEESTYEYDEDFDMKAIISEAKKIGVKLFTDPEWDAFCKKGEPDKDVDTKPANDYMLEKQMKLCSVAAYECLFLAKGKHGICVSGPNAAKMEVECRNGTSFFFPKKSDAYKAAMKIIKEFPWDSHANIEKIYQNYLDDKKSYKVKDFEDDFTKMFGYYLKFAIDRYDAISLFNLNDDWPKEYVDFGIKMINDFPWTAKQLKKPDWVGKSEYKTLLKKFNIK